MRATGQNPTDDEINVIFLLLFAYYYYHSSYYLFFSFLNRL